MHITFRTVQEFRAYRAARSAGDDLTLDAPALDDSDLRRIERRPFDSAKSGNPRSA